MTLTDLLSPGYLSNGQKLRLEAFKAINYARINADRSPDSTTCADLKAFFLDCAAKLPGKAPTKKEPK